jgi:hypothetical protein
LDKESRHGTASSAQAAGRTHGPQHSHAAELCEGNELVNVYALVVLLVAVMAGWVLLTVGASPAEAFGAGVAAALLTDHLLERP